MSGKRGRPRKIKVTATKNVETIINPSREDQEFVEQYRKIGGIREQEETSVFEKLKLKFKNLLKRLANK